MLASITPLGERGRHNRFATTAVAFVVGSTAGGLVAGTAGAALGAAVRALLGPPAAVVGGCMVAVAALGAAFDLQVGGIRLPTVRRQVDESWLDRYRGWVYGIGFGFQLGLGASTIVTTAAVYGTLALSLLAAAAGSVPGAIAIGFAFGTVRGLSILAAAPVVDGEHLRRLHRDLARRARLARRATVATQAVVMVAAVTAVALS
ncbi:MAG: hypothetical protein ACT4PW_13710 [Acidimicrobiia bacterium]